MAKKDRKRRYSYNEYRLYYSYFPTQKRENILSITSSLAVLPLSS